VPSHIWIFLNLNFYKMKINRAKIQTHLSGVTERQHRGCVLRGGVHLEQ
jgi:hypothetical protein